jgi:NAD(P)-dependent dehydrogenase (short-subunit alcohol dehydrogenase family)
MTENKMVFFGSGSSLAPALEKKAVKLIMIGRNSSNNLDLESVTSEESFKNVPLNEKHYCISTGLLFGRKISNLSRDQIISSLYVNLVGVVLLCEYILSNNQSARIVIIGSESGSKGSYDTTYFLSKAALSAFVRERAVGVKQQLVVVSPSTIEDGNMTLRRKDYERLSEYRDNHPKKRFLNMDELADVVYSLSFNCSEYLTNTEIQLNGGKFSRMP